MKATTGRLAVAVIAAALLGLSACSAGATAEPTMPPASEPQPTYSQPADTESADTATDSSADAPVEAPKGADAAPGQTDGTTQFYDSSDAARQNFYAWWNYEIQVPQDIKPLENVYEAGLVVCGSRARGAGTEAIMTVIKRDMGYTPSGAEGIYRSALEALCPQYNLGFRSYFDRNVDKFVLAAQERINYSVAKPPFYAYGFFIKEVCAAMTHPSVGGRGIYDHMRAMTHLELMEQGLISEDVLRIYIAQGVNAGCYAVFSQLPPVIQMTP